ncbi:MAG: DNA-directed RNA polymerase subunit L [Halobacteriota archaeon]
MELRVIDRDDDALSIEIGGEDHTFMNTLKSALLETEGVAAATYDMNPEQSGGQTDPILSIKTDGAVDPLDALASASRQISERGQAFVEAYEAAL